MNDYISRQNMYKTFQSVCKDVSCFDCQVRNEDGVCRFEEWIQKLPSTQIESLTDKEQRIFLAALGKEEKVCMEIDRDYAGEDSLMSICGEIKRKVKGALWT